MTGEFPAQSTSNVENGSIWWRRHGYETPWVWIEVYVCFMDAWSPPYAWQQRGIDAEPFLPLANLWPMEFKFDEKFDFDLT